MGYYVCEQYVQLACTLTFEAVHGSSCDAGINHPNQYFIDSQKILQKVNPIYNIPGSLEQLSPWGLWKDWLNVNHE